jgi:hypothetical protein
MRDDGGIAARVVIVSESKILKFVGIGFLPVPEAGCPLIMPLALEDVHLAVAVSAAQACGGGGGIAVVPQFHDMISVGGDMKSRDVRR